MVIQITYKELIELLRANKIDIEATDRTTWEDLTIEVIEI